jgi:uncharacterized protein YecT (DUF1311 family)
MIFTNNKLKPIVANDIVRNSGIQDKITSKIKLMPSFMKTLLVLFFSVQLTNALDRSYYTLDNCYDTTDDFPGDKDKCIESWYGLIDGRIDEVYEQVRRSLSKDNQTKLRQKQHKWNKEVEKACAEPDDNCYMNERVKRLEELSELDKQLNKHKFEGKWVGAFVTGSKWGNYKVSIDDFVLHIPGVFGRRHIVYGGNPIYTIYHYFLIENGENICGIWGLEDGSSKGKALYKAEDSLYARSVKMCGQMNFPCENENGAKGFTDWGMDNTDTVSAVAYQHRGTYIRQKTPFAPGEKEKLIKENKWLQDCLNYKGE